ncbi:putative nuclease HARBI1 [Electrophorus electricus]|uniref:Putative nuclease HARBI1 n=1 Tax=Electrophorus electricus TaxID=8005 RepID=A0A4W4H1B3_ELEEL|nr:putative nuclease HARBI1 [Electrophorus electricus]
MSYAGAVWLAVQEDLYRSIFLGPARQRRKSGTYSCSSNGHSDQARHPLDSFDDNFLSQCFHYNRQCLIFLVDYVKARMMKDIFRPSNDAASVEAMILATLCFYAQGFLPRKITDMLGLDHTSANYAVNVVSKVLADMAPDFITFPGSYNDRMGVAYGFKNLSGIPNVVGVLGCLHVQVFPPPAEERLFLNTLGYHSVMVQIINDVDGNLLSVEQCCPGGTMEQAVWESSNICQEFSRLQHGQTWVVGNSGLSKSRYVLTPVERSQIKTSAIRRFNTAQSQVLNSTQRVFGCLKTRFRCLRDLGAVQACALEPLARIITACCVLHNISKKFSVPLPGELVLEPVHPIPELGDEGVKNPLYYMEETREDMIEMCFGNAGEEDGQGEKDGHKGRHG